METNTRGLYQSRNYNMVVCAVHESRPWREGKIVSGLTDGTGLSEEEKSEVRLRFPTVSRHHHTNTRGPFLKELPSRVCRIASLAIDACETAMFTHNYAFIKFTCFNCLKPGALSGSWVKNKKQNRTKQQPRGYVRLKPCVESEYVVQVRDLTETLIGRLATWWRT